MSIARSELILGGQKSGKSRRAEDLARAWLAQPGHSACLLATAQPWDDEMRERIARHQRDRAEKVPGMATLEVGAGLVEALVRESRPDTLLVVDCLTLWLTAGLMPMAGEPWSADELDAQLASLVETLESLPGPVVLVSNEIGLGVIPMGRDVRAFVDALGRLNQRVAGVCERAILMAAGLPMVLKGNT
ncbi:bifunctional adenosylcobinamide kinase/adenosylcobinamide-phosphate guanylyltransferase [Hydrogenophaga aquatica]